MQNGFILVGFSLAALFSRVHSTPVPPPPIPSGVKCGGTAGSHRLSWAPLGSVDVYEVEVGLSAASAVHTPLASTTTASPSVVFEGLDATKPWWFKVRAHAKAGTGIGTDVEWSDFSTPIVCKAKPVEMPVAVAKPQATSQYTRMYRVSEVWGGRLWGRQYAPPDFLSSCVLYLHYCPPGQASSLPLCIKADFSLTMEVPFCRHDSADAPGQSSFLTFAELSLMTASETINTSTITEYCIETSKATPLGKYLSCPAGGNMSMWGPQQDECYCAHDIDRYIQHRDFCGGDTWHGAKDTCAGVCSEMWQNAISFTQQAGLQCESCTGQSCDEMMAASKPLCSGCNSTQCDMLWSYVWSTKPQDLPARDTRYSSQALAHISREQEQRRRLQSDCQCSQSSVDYSLKHVGAANISWPPGLGRWFSTPAAGECAEGVSLGTDGCTWRRHAHARLIYGFELVQGGFLRKDGPSVHGQTLVDKATHVANAKVFESTFAKHPVQAEPLCV